LKTMQNGGVDGLWSREKSILLTRVCVDVFLVCAVLMMVSGPWMVRDFLARIGGGRIMGAGSGAYGLLLALGIGCGAAAVWMLWEMRLFLRRLSLGEVFTERNVRSLRQISWACLCGGCLTIAVGVLYALFYVLVGGAALFMMLVVRVVKNAFEAAVLMKDELDYTI